MVSLTVNGVPHEVEAPNIVTECRVAPGVTVQP